MRAVDTNVLVRLITRDDKNQLARAEAFIGSGVWISHVVLAESCRLLADVYGRSHEEIASAIRMLLDEQRLAMQDPDVVEAALARYRRRPSLGFSDCLIVAIARKAGHVPLGTFDQALARIDGVQLLE